MAKPCVQGGFGKDFGEVSYPFFQPAGIPVVCVDTRAFSIGGIVLRGLCHENMHLDDGPLVRCRVLVGHEDLTFHVAYAG